MSNYLHFIFIKDLQQVLWNESVDAFHERLHLLLHAGHEAPLDHLSSNKHSRLLVTSLLSGAHLTCSHKRGTRSLSFPNLTLTTEGQSFSFPNLTLTTEGQGHFHSQIWLSQQRDSHFHSQIWLSQQRDKVTFIPKSDSHNKGTVIFIPKSDCSHNRGQGHFHSQIRLSHNKGTVIFIPKSDCSHNRGQGHSGSLSVLLLQSNTNFHEHTHTHTHTHTESIGLLDEVRFQRRYCYC